MSEIEDGLISAHKQLWGTCRGRALLWLHCLPVGVQMAVEGADDQGWESTDVQLEVLDLGVCVVVSLSPRGLGWCLSHGGFCWLLGWFLGSRDGGGWGRKWGGPQAAGISECQG